MEYTDGTVKFKVRRFGATSEDIKTALNAKQDKLTFDTTPTEGSTNPVTSEGIAAAIAGVQAGVVDGDVSNPDSWWFKLGGAIPIIIQGSYSGGKTGTWAIPFPHALLGLSGDYAQNTGNMDWGPGISGDVNGWTAGGSGAASRVIAIGW